MKTEEVFRLVKSRAVRRLSRLAEVRWQTCDKVEEEHKEADRSYAHFNHHPMSICVAKAFDELGGQWQIGIMAHEFGHALAHLLDLPNHTEDDANNFGGVLIGHKVIFKGPDRLEFAEFYL